VGRSERDLSGSARAGGLSPGRDRSPVRSSRADAVRPQANDLLNLTDCDRPTARKWNNNQPIVLITLLSILIDFDTTSSRVFTSFHRFVIDPEGPQTESLRLMHGGFEPLGERYTPIARGCGEREASMNHSIYSADRMTHIKIVVVALVAGIIVAGLSISARNTDDAYTQTARVIKAGKAVAVTSSDAMVVR
jgi:hypothetical protein